MRFETKKEREDLLISFQDRCKELEQLKRDAKGTDPNYNCKMTFMHRTEYDENVKLIESFSEGRLQNIPVEKDIEGKDLPISGDIIVAYVKQATLDQSLQIINASRPPLGNPLNSGKVAWDIMIDKANSSPEISQDRIKLGLLLELVSKVDALTYDQKKS